jgi:DNA-binding NarL/FixJ family response regulator
MKSKNNIILAEEKELSRKALVSLISTNENYQIIAEATCTESLKDILNKNIPNIIIIEYNIATFNGKEVLSFIKRKFPEVKILIMGDSEECEKINDLLTNGADGFISKNETTESFFKAINVVLTNGSYFNSSISEAMLNDLLKQGQKKVRHGKLSLSDREILVMKEICNGYTNKLISEKLFISSSTVDFHKGNIYKKTNTNNIANLVKYAIKNGIVQVG